MDFWLDHQKFHLQNKYFKALIIYQFSSIKYLEIQYPSNFVLYSVF